MKGSDGGMVLVTLSLVALTRPLRMPAWSIPTTLILLFDGICNAENEFIARDEDNNSGRCV